MKQIQRILCPVDYSEQSGRALRHACVLAQWYGARLSVLHVEDEVFARARAEALDLAAHRDPDRDLEAFAVEHGAADMPLEVRTVSGNPAARILEHADAWPADLIVMGTHGRSGLARLVLGSVTEQVIRQARCPVMAVPPHAADAAAAPAGLSERSAIQPPLLGTIVCAVDFSAPSLDAAETAMAMAQETDARLILLHVLEPAPIAPVTLPVPDPAERAREARERLARLLPADASLRFRPEARAVNGAPAAAILEQAAEAGATLIVMGVQSRGTVDVLVFGSVTRQVIRGAECPVVSVRAKTAAEESGGERRLDAATV